MKLKKEQNIRVFILIKLLRIRVHGDIRTSRKSPPLALDEKSWRFPYDTTGNTSHLVLANI